MPSSWISAVSASSSRPFPPLAAVYLSQSPSSFGYAFVSSACLIGIGGCMGGHSSWFGYGSEFEEMTELIKVTFPSSAITRCSTSDRTGLDIRPPMRFSTCGVHWRRLMKLTVDTTVQLWRASVVFQRKTLGTQRRCGKPSWARVIAISSQIMVAPRCNEVRSYARHSASKTDQLLTNSLMSCSDLATALPISA